MSKEINCEFEPEAVLSVKTGFVDDKVAVHIKTCENCREAIKIAGFFQANILKETMSRKLPAAGLIWFKSRLRQKQRAAEMVGKPILIVQMAGAAAGLATLIWLFFNRAKFPILDSGLIRVFESMEQVVFPLAAGLTALVIISILLILALRRLMIEE
jgi:hypothetical protein